MGKGKELLLGFGRKGRDSNKGEMGYVERVQVPGPSCITKV